MNLKKIGQSILWIIAGILLLSFLWQYVQRRGGIGAVFGQLFPGLGGGIWHGSVGRQPAPVPAPAPPTTTRPEPQPAPAPPRTPPVVVPAPPTTPRPVHPEADPNISMTDRLPWENNRVRSEVINALTRDIARVQGMERRWADTMPEVVAVGGVDNYLNLQRERLTRARTFPATARVAPRAPRVYAPLPPTVEQGVGAPIENARHHMQTQTPPQPLPYIINPQPSPLSPSPEVDMMLTPRVYAPLPPIVEQGAGVTTRIWDEIPIIPQPSPLSPSTVEQGVGAPTRIWDEHPQVEFLQ